MKTREPSAIFPSLCERALAPVLEAVSAPGPGPFVAGLGASSLAFLLAAMRADGARREDAGPGRDLLSRVWLLVTPTQHEAESLFQDMMFFLTCFDLPADDLTYFPDRGQTPYAADAPQVDLIAQRMRTLFRLQARRPAVVITTPAAAMQRLMPPSAFARSCVRLRAGGEYDRDALVRRLLCAGYRRVPAVDIPGEFSIRGGIMDIFSTGHAEPRRIECLGDAIESIRRFDPATQESIGAVSEADILPAREYLPPEHAGSGPVDIPPDAEWRLPEAYPVMATLPDYMAAPPFAVLDRPSALEHAAREWLETARKAWEEHRPPRHGTPYPEPSRCYADWDAIERAIAEGPSLACDTVAPAGGSRRPVVTLPVRSPGSAGLGLRGTAFAGTLAILDRLRRDGPVMIVARSSGQVERLLELCAEHDAPASGRNPLSPDGPGGAGAGREPLYILQGTLSSGFVAPSFPFTAVTEEDVFATAARHHRRGSRRTAAFLSSLDDVHAGEHVVHEQHGLCLYRGLKRLSVQDFESDYLMLEFAGRDTLYVPLDRLNRIQPYRAGDGPGRPVLDKLGGASWARTKARVAKHIEDMMDELVELYADREVATRPPYVGDTMLSHEFDAAFAYEETPDQRNAIRDVYRDMDSPRPMDRLVCGDVGYGKTEVAMRAAFQAVQTNRQVAVLAPTTLLAQQHYETFTRRFAPFPVRVGALSRFHDAKEAAALLLDLASGVVDVVIGTHRLLGKAVRFRRLGLVIIDEEQWFGVRHKERLKQLRAQVDVLTLTATPIPRTLQMAFSGVRDLSVIDTPPATRLAVRTQVAPFNPTLVRDAIRRELDRKGQVFFVHNRVETIERTGGWLRELVPEARLVMAHGQLNARVLEGVMLRFFHGEADVLLATSIIQSGLDVPRANTILVDRAHTFGLAQLYQLRGRVGRAGEQAYAYFLFPDEETLGDDARRRLTAIRDFSDLGSGFRIAAADLAIRGAGNLLGKQQSGNIAAVGFNLYMRMVEDAVRRKKGEPAEDAPEPTLHVNVSAFIADDYVENDSHRLSLYARISAGRTEDELALLHEEIRDRYGPPPDAVERLFEVMRLRLLAGALGLESLSAANGVITLTFAPGAGAAARASFDRLARRAADRLRILPPASCTLTTPFKEWPDVAVELRATLNDLLEGARAAGAVSRS